MPRATGALIDRDDRRQSARIAPVRSAIAVRETAGLAEVEPSDSMLRTAAARPLLMLRPDGLVIAGYEQAPDC